MKPSTGFVYTMPKFVRGLVDPPEGYVLMEFDYASQEIGVQAYITGDKVKAEMYEHPQFGKYYCDIAHSFWPDFISKEDHRYKTAKQMALMTEYGCGAEKLASCAGVKYKLAEKFIVHMRKLFPVYWKYVDKLIAKIIDRRKRAWFPDGFGVTASKDARPTTFGNLPFQGTGAYILRRICVELYRANIRLVAPVHDAVIVMCKEDEREAVAAKVKSIMEKASKDATGTLIKVGDPEVTYHGLVNCHSEMETKEDYLVKLPKKLASTEDYDAREYYKEFERYVGSYMPQTDIDYATEDMYVDEEFKK
jgi:DNA polymerase I-like protein with 3'-5' exonuclease and polymerase domains